MIVIFISNENGVQRLGSSFSRFSLLPLYFAILSLLRLLLCILSGVAIIYDLVLCRDCEKRLIKHLYLPLHLLALFFTRLRIPLPMNARMA